MTQETKRTKGKWEVEVMRDLEESGFYVLNGDGDCVVIMDTEEEANRIVKAVNNHDGLVEALREAEDVLNGLDISDNVWTRIVKPLTKKIKQALKEVEED